MSAHLLPGFAWMAGMLTDGGLRVIAVTPRGVGVYDDLAREAAWLLPGAVPDWTDPATGGCALALLGTEAWRVSRWSGTDHPADRPWFARVVAAKDDTFYPTLGEACAAVASALGRWGSP